MALSLEMTSTSSTAERITVDKSKKRDIILRFPGLSVEAYIVIQQLEKSGDMVFSVTERRKTYIDVSYRYELIVNTSLSIESQREGLCKIFVYIRDFYMPYHESFVSWKKEGKTHRDGDKPAIIYASGTMIWYQNGKIHRDGDKPAAIYENGTLYWYQDGKMHRDGDKPTYINANGSMYWYYDDKLHRDDDKPEYINTNGSIGWYRNGNLHRDGDKPAYIDEVGTQRWYRDGKLHSDGDKPAIIKANGLQESYLNGVFQWIVSMWEK